MHDSMLRKLDQLQERINEIQNLLVNSDTVKDIEKYTLLNKEFSELKPIVGKKRKRRNKTRQNSEKYSKFGKQKKEKNGPHFILIGKIIKLQ